MTHYCTYTNRCLQRLYIRGIIYILYTCTMLFVVFHWISPVLCGSVHIHIKIFYTLYICCVDFSCHWTLHQLKEIIKILILKDILDLIKELEMERIYNSIFNSEILNGNCTCWRQGGKFLKTINCRLYRPDILCFWDWKFYCGFRGN